MSSSLMGGCVAIAFKVRLCSYSVL